MGGFDFVARGLAIQARNNLVFDPSSLASLPTYFGQVATKTNIAGNAFTANKYLMSRTVHAARDDITSLTACWPNFHCQGALGEQSFASPLTLSVGLEYPLGAAPVRIMFGGSATGQIQPLSILRNDPFPIAIRRGTRFAFRSLQYSPAGIIYSNGKNYGIAGENDREGSVASPNAVVDNTLTNVLVDPSISAYGPCAIVGPTSRPAIFLAGDSRFLGSGESAAAQDPTGAKGECERSVAGDFAFINAAAGGDRLQSCIGNYALRLSLAEFCSHGVHDYGINDIINGRAASAILADDVTFASMFKIPMWVTTISPHTDSSDFWASVAGQSIPSPGQETQRKAVNRGRRRIPQGYAGCFDTADVVENVRDGGLWQAAFAADGLHANESATLAIQRSRVIDARAFASRIKS